MATNRISPEEANARVQAGEPVMFLDARNPEAWQKSGQKIPGALRVTPEDVESRLNEIPDNATVVAYCT